MLSQLKPLQDAVTSGNATEHTHRPALKTLIESLDAPLLKTTSELKRIACGAPDYVVNRRGGTVGYIEAKVINKLVKFPMDRPRKKTY